LAFPIVNENEIE
jgi:hypothetical protein